MQQPPTRDANRDGSRSYDPAPHDSDSILPVRAHLLDYVRVLYKRRWTALPIFFAVAGLMTFAAFTATPIYEARTQLLIEVENPNVVTFQEVIEQERATTDYYETQYTILRSRILARKTLDALQLWEHPEFTGSGKASFSIRGLADGALSSVVSVMTKLLSPAPPASAQQTEGPASDESAEQSARINAFLGRLSVEPVRNSRLVDVKFRSANPVIATEAVNALARAYIELLQEFKFQASKEASDWLNERLAEQDRNVAAAEMRLQQYREQNGAVAVEGHTNIVEQKLADLSAAVTRARTERINKETLYNQLRAIQKEQQQLDTFPAIQGNSYVQQLKSEVAALQQQHNQLSERLADRHPEMIKVRSALDAAQAKLQNESAKIVQSIENDYLAARALENNLAGAVEAQKRELLAQDRVAIKFEALQRDATTDRQIFSSLLQRAKETGISGELKTSNIRVVDLADRPRVPVEPRKARSMLIGLFTGAVLALGFSFFFEYLDKRIKSPDEMKALGLPFLGLVPAVDDSADTAGAPLLSGGASSHFAEALRGLRTKLLVSSTRGGQSRSIVVTSTGPNEGKTLMAANLAVALAQATRQVLLIDADMRQPRVHETLNIDRTPGLSNVLAGTATVSQAVRASSVRGLWILPAGDHPPHAAELLASQRFETFLKLAAQRFEWIIVDSPPVLAVTDACVIAPLVSGVLFVVGSEMTNRQSVQTALEELEAVNAKFVGTLLNRVKIYRNRYYYSDYYKTEYGQYYENVS